MILFLGGLLLALVAIVVSTLLDGNSLGPLVGPTSLLMVVGGAVGASLMAYRTNEISTLPRSAVTAVKADVPDVAETISALARLADTARRDGMLALEAKLEEIEDRYIGLGVQLLVDGADEEVVQQTLEIEMVATDERHQNAIGFFRTLAGYGPTFGMVGTVIGLINMLGNLSDPSQLGKGMAMALLTTLYGVLFANLVAAPIANRLERLNTIELAAMEVTLDGILTIRRGASPRALIERLESYLPPTDRIGATERLATLNDAA